MPQTASHRVLVIDDTPGIHDDFRKIFHRASPAVSEVAAAAAALFDHTPLPPPDGPLIAIDSAFQGQEGAELVRQALAENRPYALALVDMRMPPGWDGLRTIQELWRIDPALQIVICTAHSDQSWHDIHAALGTTDSLMILKKPFDHIEVRQLASALCRKWDLTRENAARLAELDQVVRERTRELRTAEERFSHAFDACPLPQAIQDLETGRILEINLAHEKFSGVTRQQVLGITPETFAGHGLDPQRWRSLLVKLRSGQAIDEWPFVYTPPTGSPRQMRASGRAVTIADRPCAIWVFRDVTEQIHLEQQFRHSQKMEAVGQLAAGVAHDFNNLLTVILGCTSFVLDDANLPAEHRASLSQVSAAGERAAALTRQLLLFSRRQIVNPEPLDIGATLGNLRGMLARLLPERIHLEWHCDKVLPLVLADVANLEQIVMNLVVNARDAIPANGTIRLELDAVFLGERDLARHPDARAGSFLRLRIADTGKGMDPAILSRIFEPFFTTKDVGQGTGLGLSTVYGIVHQHDGWIEVESTPRLGSTFSVFLPTITTPAGNAPAPADAAPTAARIGRGERILLVEDEPFVRDTTKLLATRAGYDVTTAPDGPSALKIWETAERPFALLLTDMMMPNGMTGAELALQLRARAPELKIILSTGYSEELLKHGGQTLENTRLLLKPYDASKLLELLRETFAS